MKKPLPGYSYNAKKKLAHFEVILPGLHGAKRRRKTVEARDAIEATTLYHAFRKEVAEAEKGPAVPLTLRWYYETHWSKMKAGLSPKGRESVEQAMRSRILPHLGDMLLKGINDAEVGDFVAALREKKYAPETINGTLSTLRKFLRDAVAREVIEVYPIRRRLPRQKAAGLRLELSQEERAAFLSALDDEVAFRELVRKENAASRVVRIEDRRERGLSTSSLHGGGLRPDGEAVGYNFQRFRELKPLFVVALETGLRKGDLLALRWSSVKLKDGWVVVTMGKTTQDARIALSKLCREALEEFRARLDRDHDGTVVELRRRDPDPEALVVVDEDGKPILKARMEDAFKTAKKLAGIKRRFRFHDLRHSFASTLASQGVSLQVIAKALGHTTTKMSERYARPDEAALYGMAAALDRANSATAGVSPASASRHALATTEGGTRYVDLLNQGFHFSREKS